ncbi:hypothetical protein P10159_3266 [Citrobacter portucalensis]|nr:hypothetical protein P10159_3266 [Citrobacter portucalensis]
MHIILRANKYHIGHFGLGRSFLPVAKHVIWVNLMLCDKLLAVCLSGLGNATTCILSGCSSA